MAKNRFDEAIDKVVTEMKEAGADKDRTVWDPTLKRHGARIYVSTGVVSYFINYRAGRVEKRHTIGKRPVWTGKSSAEEARELLKRVDRGEDPAAERREEREAPTIKDLADRYLADHLPNMKNYGDKRRRKDEETKVNIVLEHLGARRKVVDIVSSDIETVHTEVTKRNGPRRANQVRSVMSVMFNMALRIRAKETKPWRDAVMGNPVEGTRKNKEKGVERFYSERELAKICDAMNELEGRRHGFDDNGIAKWTFPQFDAFRLTRLVGCRPGEARTAAWEGFDSEPGYWIQRDVKQGGDNKVPLGAPALELIERLRRARRPGAVYVFPSPEDRTKPFVNSWDPWRRVRELSGVEGRIHDFRHTVASTGIANGMSLFLVGKLLGHKQAATTQRYAHLADDPLKAAADKVSTAIANASRGGADDPKVMTGPTWRR
jgi:integrase